MGRIKKLDELESCYNRLYNQTQVLINQLNVMEVEVNTKFLGAKNMPTKSNIANYRKSKRCYDNLKKQISRNNDKLMGLQRQCMTLKCQMMC